jgi:hypothetical protein
LNREIMGRPPKEIDMNKLESLMRFRPDKGDIAAFFQVSPDTIERRIKEWCGLTFTELRDEQMTHTKLGLTQEALLRAKKSDTILIFCLKNLCGWSNGPEIAIQNNVQAIATNNEAKIQIEERIKQLLEGKNGKN